MAFYGMQMQRKQAGVIPGLNTQGATLASRRIAFDETIISGMDNTTPVVTHNAGLFTINRGGNYLITWFVTVRTGLGDQGLKISLYEEHFAKNAQSTDPHVTEQTYPSTHSMKTGQVSGSAVLTIPDNQVCKLGLYNESIEEITLSSYSNVAETINANIMIMPYAVGTYSSSFGLIGMNLIREREAGNNLLTGGSPVIFTKAVGTYPATIFSFDTTTGDITTLVAGNYIINWSVNLDGSEDVESISFSIVHGENVLATVNSTVLLQQTYSGFAFITTSAGDKIQLINSSVKLDSTPASVTYSNTKVLASLQIIGHS